MRTIIAGSRGITNYADVEEAVRASGFVPSVVLSGGARGIDTLGERWAELHGIPCERFKADWNKLGKQAGVLRNQQMAENATALVAIWDGRSRGTRDMINRARKEGLAIYVHHTTPTNSASNAPAKRSTE